MAESMILHIGFSLVVAFVVWAMRGYIETNAPS